MKIQFTKSIDRGLWLRYLRAEEDPQLLEQMEQAEQRLLRAADIRWIYRVMERGQVPTGGISIEKHLEGCKKAAVLAVTCGSEIDALIRRAEITEMAMAVLLDTGASVLAEQAADLAEEEIRARLTETGVAGTELTETEGCFLTPRFSPGYGDYPIRCQREILNAVDAPRKIGLTVTAGDLMVPHKSITAVIGIADHPVKGRLATCEECLLKDKCELRREGRHC